MFTAIKKIFGFSKKEVEIQTKGIQTSLDKFVDIAYIHDKSIKQIALKAVEGLDLKDEDIKGLFLFSEVYENDCYQMACRYNGNLVERIEELKAYYPAPNELKFYQRNNNLSYVFRIETIKNIFVFEVLKESRQYVNFLPILLDRDKSHFIEFVLKDFHKFEKGLTRFNLDYNFVKLLIENHCFFIYKTWKEKETCLKYLEMQIKVLEKYQVQTEGLKTVIKTLQDTKKSLELLGDDGNPWLFFRWTHEAPLCTSPYILPENNYGFYAVLETKKQTIHHINDWYLDGVSFTLCDLGLN